MLPAASIVLVKKKNGGDIHVHQHRTAYNMMVGHRREYYAADKKNEVIREMKAKTMKYHYTLTKITKT